MTLKTASSLLLLMLLVSIKRGLQDVKVFHYKTMVAIVGQNISLPCPVKEVKNSTIVSTEWSKKDKKDTKPDKLTLYAPNYGKRLFSPNVNVEIINDDAGKLVGTKLELYNLKKRHAGTYICAHTSFPLGTRQNETVLKIKDKIECDKNSTIEVNPGENVTIHCFEFTGVEYTWTKNMTVVSDSPSLHMSVSEGTAGIYTLTVNTGNNRLSVKFNITVQTKTTNSYTDVTTLMAHYNTSGVPDTTSNALDNSTVTDYAQSSVTTIPTTHIQPIHLQNTSSVPIHTIYNQSESFNTSQSFNKSESSNTSFSQSESTTTSFKQSASTVLYYNQSETFNTSLTFNQTIETTTSFNTKYTSLVTETNSKLNKTDLLNDSLSKSFTTLTPTISLGTTALDPDATQTSRPENTTDVTVQQDPGDLDGHSYLLMMLMLIIVGGVLLLSIVAIVLYRRRVIKERMELPPPFKPPPPPVKYSAARSPPQQFPTDRCNSISAATVEIRHTFV